MTTRTSLTLDEFLKQPETKPYREFCAGEVREKPMPDQEHAVIQSLLSYIFWTFLRLHPIGVVGSELRCLLQRDGKPWAPVPDFVFVSHQRLGGGVQRGPLPIAPDLAVEILSPDDTVADALAKLRAYLANGVRLAWLVDPQRRTVLVLTGPEAMRLLTEDEMLDGGDVLPGFSAAVREILPPTGFSAG